MIACCGNRFPAVKIISTTRLNRQLKRESANATIDAMISVMITAGIVVVAGFREKRGEAAWLEGFTKVWKVSGDGVGREAGWLGAGYGRGAGRMGDTGGGKHVT